jgi:hypothetical protein
VRTAPIADKVGLTSNGASTQAVSAAHSTQVDGLMGRAALPKMSVRQSEQRRRDTFGPRLQSGPMTTF